MSTCRCSGSSVKLSASFRVVDSRRSDALDSAEARGGEPATASIAEERRAISCCQPKDLGTPVGARLTVAVHSAQMRNDNPTELTVFRRLADLVDDLDQRRVVSRSPLWTMISAVTEPIY